MILIGFKDLSAKKMINILQGKKLQIEKKIIPQFLSKNYVLKQPLQNPPKTPLDFTVDELSGNLFDKSVLLYLICFSIKKRDFLELSVLEGFINKLNNYENRDNFVENFDLMRFLDFLKDEKKKEIFLESFEEIYNSARSLLTYYFLELFFNLNIIEGCVFLENSKFGYNFMSEIEKGNYENRKVARILNLYRNYFGPTTSGKKSPGNNFISEIFLTLQFSENMTSYKTYIVSLFNYQGKPFLQNKLISQSKHLSSYFASSGNLILKNIRVQLQLISEEKNLRKKQDITFTNELDLTIKLVWNNLETIHEILEKNQSQLLELQKKNPKLKKKYSQSYQSLQTLLSPKNFKTTKKILSSNLSLLKETITQILSPHLSKKKKPKLPKGTRDYTPLQMNIKSKAISLIKEIYKKHGGLEIDTPVFELKETLIGKYGEEGGKLIYDLEDQGGELLSLRYDLTVPFARYMGLNNCKELKRFHIGKVYRRDQPNINKGRFREFYQCDFDVCGRSDEMMADSEVLKIMCEILKAFDLKFEIKISHRLLLEAIVECSECDLRKFTTICSSIDKLDKEPWEAVANELVSEKGLSEKQVSNLKRFVLFKGGVSELLDVFDKEKTFGDNENARKSLEDMRKLEKNLKILKVQDDIVFDLSLARGLDYYTGLIYEAVLVGESGIGSVGGGGRYDGLIGMFSKRPIPSVGMSIGIERLFMILEKKMAKSTRKGHTEIFVATIGKNIYHEKLRLLNIFWENGIKCEGSYMANAKTDKQMKYVLENKIPFIIWIGESEIKEECVNFKNLYLKTEEKIKMKDLVEVVKKNLEIYYQDLKNGKVVFNK